MRKFRRHPSCIPVSVEVLSPPQLCSGHASDASMAGLCCEVEAPIEVGAYIMLRIPSLSIDSLGRARVVWCRQLGSNYQLGVAFCSGQDAYRARMFEQVCEIEAYRQRLARSEGRQLSGEEAAAEWIEQFAADFQF